MKKINDLFGTEKIPGLKKLLRLMKLTVFFILISVGCVLAGKSYSQTKTLTFHMENSTVKEVLAEIESQSEFRIMYSGKFVDVDREVSLDVKNQKIESVLNTLFAGTDVSYTVRDRFIVLVTPELMVEGTLAVTQQRAVSGKVTDSNNQPLPGVTVVVKGTTQGTVTNNDGNYTLSNIPDDATLVFSFVGMRTQEVVVGEQTSIDVRMEEETIGIEEVVAVGYGTVKKRDLTGAINQVVVEDLESETTSNMTDFLRGSIPGVNVTFDTSASGIGSASGLQIRGATNLRGADANAPLIVVDGMLYSGSLADLNPHDISRVDVLKDASSAAIYGSRASNGVIIITSKKGKLGKPNININASVGVAVLSGAQIEMMNGEEFINWRIAGFESAQRHHIGNPGYYKNPNELPSNVTIDQWKAYDGSSQSEDITRIWLQRIGFSDLEISNYKEGKTINWKDYEYQTGLRQDYNISLTGGTENLTYYWSLGYVNNEGIIYNETYENYRTRINLEANATSFLKVGLNANFSVRDQSPLSATVGLRNHVTPYSSFYEEDGETIRHFPSGGLSMTQHPWNDIVYRERLRDYNSLNSKIYTNITLPFNISLTSEYITLFDWNRDFNHYSAEQYQWSTQGGIASRIRSNSFEWQLNNILKWNKTFNSHNFDLTFVQNAEKYQYWREEMTRDQFEPSDVLGYHRIQAGIRDRGVSSNDTYSTADALLLRLNYTLNDRYLFTSSFRRDGFSAFGQENPRASFGSAAIGWILSEEEFFNIEYFDLIKIRTSYGTNGNRSIGIYQALSDMSTGKYILQRNGSIQYVSELYISRMSNESLKWERTGAYNIGFDFSMFNGRIQGNTELYYMQTKDLLISRKLPDITGFSSVAANLGQVDNKGIEFVIKTINMKRNNFSWSTDFSFSHNRNKIVSLYGNMIDILDKDGNVIGQKEADDVTNEWFIGHALDQIWDYKVVGIWQLEEEEEAAKYSRVPGDYKLEDINDDGYYTNEDKIFQGYRDPKFRLTLRNDFNYQNWSLGVKMYSYLGFYSPNNNLRNNNVLYDRGSSYNVPYWTPENPNNKWARIESFDTGFNVYENNSFVRVDNISLTYEVPRNFLQRLQIQRCALSLIAQNPLVWAPNWSWMDPENKDYDTPSYYTLKLNVTL